MAYNWDEIKQKYLNRDKNMTKKEFAEKEGINYSVFCKKSYRENWDGTAGSDQLTEKQKLFCYYYIKYYNASKAYRLAYPDCSTPGSASQNALSLMKQPKIKNYIKKVQKEIQENLLFDAQSIIRKYIDIAFADIFDIIEVKNNKIFIKDDADGTIVQSIQPTRKGFKVELVDKMEALKELSKRFGLDKSDFDKYIQLKKLELYQKQIDLKEKGDEEALAKLDNILKAIDEEVGGD